MGKVEDFYTDEYRDKILEISRRPENRLRGITEETGLRILDGIYLILKLLLDASEDKGKEENGERVNSDQLRFRSTDGVSKKTSRRARNRKKIQRMV